MKISAVAFGAVHILLLAVTVSASQAAWSTDMGPQLVLQDPTTNLLHHSTCNTSAELVFPVTNPLILETEIPPKANTSLAGVGWFDAVTAWACLWYQDSSNNLIYARYECNSTNGVYELRNSEIVSTTLPKGVHIHDETALGAVLLGAEEGIRVYAHDKEKKILELSFQNPTGWQYAGFVTSEAGHGLALAAAASASKEVTVVVPGERKLQVIKKGIRQAEWATETVTLESEGSPSTPEVISSIALTIDEEGNRAFLYLATDGSLHLLSSLASEPQTWRPQPSQSANIWPKAYASDAPLTITSRPGHPGFTLYYQTSSTTLASITYSKGEWSMAALPILSPQTAPFITPDATAPRNEPAEKSSERIVPEEAVIALSTTLPILFLALCAAAVWTFLARRSRIETAPRRAPSRTRPRSTDVAFRHVRPYSEFGDLSWEDGGSDTVTGSSPWRRKRGWTC